MNSLATGPRPQSFLPSLTKGHWNAQVEDPLTLEVILVH